MAARSSGPVASVFVPLVVAGVAGGGVAQWFGLPGFFVVWVGLVAASWCEPAPALSGVKDRVTGVVSAAGGRERAWLWCWELAQVLRWRLFFPWLLPGWPLRVGWLGVWAGGVLVAGLPLSHEWVQVWWVGLVNGGFAVLVGLVVSRAVADASFGPVSWVDAGRVGRLRVWVAVSGVGLLAGGLVGWWWPVGVLPRVVVVLSGGLVGFVGVWLVGGLVVVAGRWRESGVRDARWGGVFEGVASKLKEPVPRVVSVEVFGPVEVCRVGVVDGGRWLRTGRDLQTAAGAGLKLCVVPAPVLDGQGVPVVGSCHPNEVLVVSWQVGSEIDVCDPGLGVAGAGWVGLAGLVEAMDGLPPVVLGEVRALHVERPVVDVVEGWGRLWRKPVPVVADGSGRAVWAMSVAGASWRHIRTTYGPQMGLGLGCEVLVNDRPPGDGLRPGGQTIFFGELSGQGVTFAEGGVEGCDPLVVFEDLREEDLWFSRWESLAVKGGKPEPHAATRQEGSYRGVVARSLSFTVLQGQDVAEIVKADQSGRLKTVLPLAGWVSLVGFPGVGGRRGDRHPLAFTVRWAEGVLPVSPDRLAPVGGDVPGWVLAGLVNGAFDSVRLARPEVVGVRALTVEGSAGHVWRVELRLYGGVTLAKVRAALPGIGVALSAPWVHVTPGGDAQSVVLVVGARFWEEGVVLAGGPVEELYLVGLRWEKVFAGAQVVNRESGELPVLVGQGCLEGNGKVGVLDFRLPAGLTRGHLVGALEKLKVGAGVAFVQVGVGVLGADSVRVLVCEDDPMPWPAGVDVGVVDDVSRSGVCLPWATGVDGGGVFWDVGVDPHLLVVGGTGSGKTVVQQVLVCGALVSGWQVFVADESKAAADLRFAEPWLSGLATTVDEIAVLMEWVYGEVRRRKDLNAQHGVGSYVDLPVEVRPRPVAVFLDEFTSLIVPSPVRKPVSDDPGLVGEYREAVARAGLVERIGARAGNLVREARSAGVALVLGAQRLTAKTLEGVPGGETLRANMARVLLGPATYGDRQAALRNPDGAPHVGDVVPAGRGIFEGSATGSVLVQAWYEPTEVLAGLLRDRLGEGGVVAPDFGGLRERVVGRQAPVEGAVLFRSDEPVLEGVDLGGLVLPDSDLVEPACVGLPPGEVDVPLVGGLPPLPSGEPVTVLSHDMAGDVSGVLPPGGVVVVSDRVLDVPAHSYLWVGDTPPPPGWHVPTGGLFGDPILDAISHACDVLGADTIHWDTATGDFAEVIAIVAGRAKVYCSYGNKLPNLDALPDF